VPVYLDGLGKVQALNTVTIRAQIDGKIMETAFHEGQNVLAGDLLLQIDPRPYQAALDQAIAKQNQDQAQLGYAQKVLERDTGLFDKKIIDRQSLDLQQATTAQLEALVKADEAAVANAKVQLEFTKITAPIDGRVGLRLVDKGNIVHANDQAGLAVITQLQPISVVFTLPEGNLRDITKKLKTNGADESLAVAALDPQNNQVLGQGELRAMDNQVDEATGTIKLKAVFQNRQFELWPGQFVNIRLLVDTRRQQLVVPSSAVNQGPSGEFIYIIRPDLVAEVRAIKVGISEDGSTVIENGVSEGEDVVVDGQYLLKANARVVLKK
jgi:multidrug efflux system membrane fusion protein